MPTLKPTLQELILQLSYLKGQLSILDDANIPDDVKDCLLTSIDRLEEEIRMREGKN